MVSTKGVGKLGEVLKRGDKAVGKAVGNLQRHAEQHREDEEECHLLALEELEGVETEALHKALVALGLAHGAVGECHGVERQADAYQCALVELHVVSLEARKVADEHGNDEAHSAEYADWRKGLDGVVAALLERGVCHGVRQRQRRHVERHAQRVEDEHGGYKVALRKVARTRDEDSRKAVADAQKALCRYPLIGDDTHDGGHEDGYNALHGVEPTNRISVSLREEIASHRCKI